MPRKTASNCLEVFFLNFFFTALRAMRWHCSPSQWSNASMLMHKIQEFCAGVAAPLVAIASTVLGVPPNANPHVQASACVRTDCPVLLSEDGCGSFVSMPAILQTFIGDIIYDETWLHSDIYDSEVTPPGFNVVRTDRQHGRGGGVAIFLSGDPDKPTAEQPAVMLQCLHPPLRAFKQGQRGHLAWLDAVLEINNIIDEPTKHALLFSTLPADLQYLSAASSASPRPYNALRAAVLAYNEYFASAAAKRAVVPGPRPTQASNPPPKPVTTNGTSRPPSSLSLSESTLDIESPYQLSGPAPRMTSPPALSEVPAFLERNLTSSTVVDLSDSGDTANTTPADRTLVTSSVPYTASPADRDPVPATSTSMPSDLGNDPSTTVIPWQQQSISASLSSVVQELAHHELAPSFSGVATKAEAPDNNAPTAPLLEPPTYDDLTPPAEPHAIFHTSLAPSTPGDSVTTSAPSDLPAVSTSSPVTQAQAARATSVPHSAPTMNSAQKDCEPLTSRRTSPSLWSCTKLLVSNTETVPLTSHRGERLGRLKCVESAIAFDAPLGSSCSAA
ncbi:hypothetical protein HPB50_004759 [Hyalomma asiaticum]|uniref:Uncharacterized protein n=1 Tax=Hyalomma asiaticum TaxID=266040 RepID=A0ACB7S7G0_HYAAI|nr:hypothetical protein HPB50_004759 [Hyalomma asiaticum]